MSGLLKTLPIEASFAGAEPDAVPGRGVEAFLGVGVAAGSGLSVPRCSWSAATALSSAAVADGVGILVSVPCFDGNLDYMLRCL